MKTITRVELFIDERQQYLNEARKAARTIILQKGFATVDMVREKCPLPEYIKPNIMAAVFNRSDFKLVGYTKSTRKVCGFRPIGMFRLRDKLYEGGKYGAY